MQHRPLLKTHSNKTLPDPLLKPFSDLNWLRNTFLKILKDYDPQHEFVTISFFKDGAAFNGMNRILFQKFLEEGNALTDLACSVRITNLQLIELDVFKMGMLLSGQLDRSFTCNLYFTPGAERNCFTFHVDHQETYACQLLGSKEWQFPMENGQILIKHDLSHTDGKSFQNHELTKILLEPLDQLQVPYGMIHQVVIQGNEPSLHLTFGSVETPQDELIHYLLGDVLNEQGLDKSQKAKIDSQELEQIIEKLKIGFSKLDSKKFAEAFTQKMFADQMKTAKFGRSYKTSTLTNQD